MTTLTERVLQAATVALSNPAIEEELHRIDDELERTFNPHRRTYLFAAYQALQWARSPMSFAPPSEMR